MCTIQFRLCDVGNMNCCQALLNLSSLIKQALPAFNKITSFCDFRLFEAFGPQTFSSLTAPSFLCVFFGEFNPKNTFLLTSGKWQKIKRLEKSFMSV